MTAMRNSPGRRTWAGQAATLGGAWVLLAWGAWVYARMRGMPEWAAMPVAAAFLIEIPFYLSPGFRAAREWLAALGKPRAAALLTASALVPWLVCSLATGQANPLNLFLLLLVAGGVSFWYIALPMASATDALFLIFIAGVYLSKIFERIYLSPAPSLPSAAVTTLGHLMLIRTAALSILIIRGNVRAEYRFLPRREEWLTGLRYFAVMLPVIGIVYRALGLVELRRLPVNPALTVLLAIGTFFTMLWVVALSEEFFFRGLLQGWLERWTGNDTAALIVASVVFGCAHLGFHRKFPNWQWAIIAGILGLFCGAAWRRSRSVQAAMVAHALLVTVWRVFLRS
ncbi:MAG: CPBP family intramembrane metalloprotease [Acidobacteriota bacterium]|nr:CPBP family intramembrane metalloprotease [Acidobacteriota bacterium]